MLRSSSAALSQIGSSSGRIFLNDEELSFNSSLVAATTTAAAANGLESSMIQNITNNSNNNINNNNDSNETLEYYNCNNNYYNKPNNFGGGEYDSLESRYVNLNNNGVVEPPTKPPTSNSFNNLKEFHEETSQVIDWHQIEP